MLTRNLFVSRAVRPMAATVLAMALVALFCPSSSAQVFSNQRSVGGISVDANGQLANATVDDQGKLSELRARGLEQIPADLSQMTGMRKISLRALEAAIENSGKKLPDEIKYLAGLQQIRYVFVYPETRDIVLAGPGEGWEVDKRGNVVGVTTRRPVMLLDDLLIALRTARQAAQGGISCSIDPTPEGIARLQNLRLRAGADPYQTAGTIEKLLGPQKVTFTGVPATSHFARVLIAADYRMKRLGMGFEPSPVPGLPSYLKMIKSTGRGMSTMAPRWWLEPDYESVLHSPDGLAWELCGGSVKTMTEVDFFAGGGNRQHTGRVDVMAQRWAELMTEKYDELAVAEPIFGQLRNCMELAVVGALVVKERLVEKAGYSMPILLDPADAQTEEFFAPKQLDSKASLMKKSRGWVITASGGVQVNSWQVADKAQQSDAPAKARPQAAPGDKTNWRWN